MASDSRRRSSNLGQFLCAPFGGRFWGHPRSRICDLGGRLGFRDRQTGFSLNQIEIDGFERFWRQNWSVFACSVWGQVLGPVLASKVAGIDVGESE